MKKTYEYSGLHKLIVEFSASEVATALVSYYKLLEKAGQSTLGEVRCEFFEPRNADPRFDQAFEAQKAVIEMTFRYPVEKLNEETFPKNKEID